MGTVVIVVALAYCEPFATSPGPRGTRTRIACYRIATEPR